MTAERYCYEKQPGSGPFYCVSVDNFLGEAGSGGDRGAMVLRGKKDGEVQANMQVRRTQPSK